MPSATDVASRRDERTAALVAYAITVAFLVSLTVDMLNPRYDPPAYVGPLMVLTAGVVLRAKRNGHDKDPGDPTT